MQSLAYMDWEPANECIPVIKTFLDVCFLFISLRKESQADWKIQEQLRAESPEGIVGFYFIFTFPHLFVTDKWFPTFVILIDR